MRLVDLFAGCGGMTEGFRAAGFKPVGAVEFDAHAAATHRANFGDHVLEADIQEVDAASLPDCDVVVGGPPCQGFSMLGRREPSDPRNALWGEYGRIVSGLQPSAFVLENVPQFLKSDQFLLLQSWTKDGGPLAGYRLASGVLNAADYGVAQKRRRAIVVGSRVGEPLLPEPSHGSGRLPWRTLREALEGVPLDIGPHELPDATDGSGAPGPVKAAELHLARRPTQLSLDRYDHVPPGGNRFDLPDELLPPCWIDKPTGTTDGMGRLEWDKPSVTIRTEFFKPEKGRYLHPQHDDERRINRPISHWEAARIQSFPDNFQWSGSKLSIARQIGNAVPPLLAEAIARSVSENLGGSVRAA